MAKNPPRGSDASESGSKTSRPITAQAPQGDREGLPETLRQMSYADLRGGFVRGTLSGGLHDREPVDPLAHQLWTEIHSHTEDISYPKFADFVVISLNSDKPMPNVLGKPSPKEWLNQVGDPNDSCASGRTIPNFIPGTDIYAVLKVAAEIFLLLRCGVCLPRTLDFNLETQIFGKDPTPELMEDLLANFLGRDQQSYIRGILRNVFDVKGAEVQRLELSPFSPLAIGYGPCLMELIWSYWHEEGMLVQTLNAISLRFQNIRTGNGRDPLADFEIDPLRPLSGFLWGYLQDEPHRLTVARRAYEYSHQYGLTLYGKAVPQLRPVDTRSKFLQAFHDLLRRTDQFYREAADTNVKADPFPLLIALRDLHMILSEGAHNQFRDLPWTARVEMLVQQWLLARPEMRDFLRGRHMVPYPEGWMGAVDTMKRLQGWSDTNITHFHDLATYGERILLSVRHVAWNEISDPFAARDWADFWRPEIQGYIHAYRMVTGVGLSDDVVEVSRTGDSRYLQPSFHLRNRLLEQQKGPTLPEGDTRARLQLGALPRTAPRQS